MATMALAGGASSYIRVAKPGYDALTDITQQHLLLQTSSSPMGAYSTGTIAPASSAYRNFGSGVAQCTFAYSNPISGGIPIVFVQQQNSDGTWGGEYNYYYGVTYKELEDTTPPHYFYDTTQSYAGFSFGVNPSNVQMNLFGPNTNTIRYMVFSNQSSTNIYAAQDTTPDGLSWTGDSEPGNLCQSSTATIANLGAGVSIVLRIDMTVAQGASSAFQSSCQIVSSNNDGDAGTYYWQNGTGTLYVPVENGDQVTFFLRSNDNAARNIGYYVYNDTQGDTAIGTPAFNLYTGYVANNPSPTPVWGNVSGTNSASTATVVLSGINVPINLGVVFSSTYVGYIGMNGGTPTYFNGPSNTTTGQYGSWSVYAGESLYFTFTPVSTFNYVYGIVNQTANNQENSSNINITVPTNSVVASWSNISGIGESAHAFGSQTFNTSTATINSISGTHTLSYSRSGTRAFYVVVNGTTTALSGTSGSFTVTSGATVYFGITISGYVQYSDTVSITDSTTGTAVSSWTIHLDYENND